MNIPFLRWPLLALACVSLSGAATGWALEPSQVELLYPDGPPGAMGEGEKDKPTLSVFLAPADKANGAAVMICPGGGYGGLATNHEGVQIAEWLNGFGVSAFMLKYRLSPYRHPVPLNDAQRGLRMVRANAEKWKVDPQRIGVIGFSAGGHLASTLGTHFSAGQTDAADPVERVSSRPDFMMLIYPVISLTSEFTHVGSRNNLLGKEHDAKLAASLSNDTQVTAQTPPTFLLHTGTDRVVPPENSVLFYLACRKANVPVEMHIYERGPHGFGLAANDPILSSWPARCQAWIDVHGFLKAGK